MEKALAAQPKRLGNVLDRDLGTGPERLTAARRIWLVGTGTSQHAAELGTAMFNDRERWVAWSSSAAFAQRPPALAADDAVIVISHTGQTAFAQSARRLVQSSPAELITITGADAGWPEAIVTGPAEASETYTVSYTAAVMVLARLAGFAADQLAAVPAAAQAALDHARTDPIALPERLLVIVGAGLAAVTAREGALKLREAARVLSEGYEGEYLLHGGAVPLTSADGLVLLEAESDASGLLPRLARAATAAGITVHEISEPSGLPEPLAQLPLTIRLQALAARAAAERGQDPDTVIIGPWADAGLWAAGGPGSGDPDSGDPDSGDPDTGDPDTGAPDTGGPDMDRPRR